MKSGQSGQVLHPLWGSEGTTAQTNLLLLQQPGITVPPVHVRTPQLRRAESKSKKSKSMYLPILNSYPRIAPNLNKKAPEKLQANRKGSSEEHSLSKRVCTKETKEEVSISTQVPEKHSNKQLERLFQSHSHSSFSHSHSLSSSSDSVQKSSCSPTPELLNMGTSAFTGLNSTVSRPKTLPLSRPCSSPCSEPATPLPLISKVSLSAGSVKDPTVGLHRHRRFLNTVEILSQSGLLDITLRTQELLRQSAVTEQNITQLRQHTRLLCQTAQAGSSVPSLEKMHRAMLESGCYPNLRKLLFMSTNDGELVADGSSRNHAEVTCGCDGQGQPPCSLLTTKAVREGRDLPSAGFSI